MRQGGGDGAALAAVDVELLLDAAGAAELGGEAGRLLEAAALCGAMPQPLVSTARPCMQQV